MTKTKQKISAIGFLSYDMKNILREDFVKKIHKKVYKEDIVKTLLIKDP